MASSPSATRSNQNEIERLRRGNQRIIVAILVVTVIALTAVVYAVASNLVNRTTPRTYVERQVDMLESVVQEKPESEEAWADYALALVAAGQYSKAEKVLDSADRALGGEVVDIVYVRARLAAADGDPAKALELVEKAIGVGVEFRKAELARLAEKAVFPEENTIKGPILASAYYFQGSLYADTGQWDQALIAFGNAIKEEPSSADALVARGNAYLEVGDEEAARADFERALSMIPDYQPALDGREKAGKDPS
jgi:tetratricopeptide (TPR) repeat protein